jgi:hypothetical protein
MLDTLLEPSEVADKFYNTESADDSEQEQPEAEGEEVEESDIEEDGEELEGEDTEEEAEDEDGNEPLDVFGQEITREEFETMQKQQLMHSDYTKKTQALAEDRKQVEALNTELKSYIAEFESQIVNEVDEAHLNELLEDGDTAEYLRLQNQNKANKAKLKAVKSKQSELLKTAQAEETKKLVEVMTDWADPKTGQATQKADIDTALEFAAEIGFTNEDLEKLADHKVIRALIDAGKYRKLKKSTPAISKRKTPAAKKASKKPAQAAKKNLSAADLFYGKKDK